MCFATENEFICTQNVALGLSLSAVCAHGENFFPRKNLKVNNRIATAAAWSPLCFGATKRVSTDSIASLLRFSE